MLASHVPHYVNLCAYEKIPWQMLVLNIFATTQLSSKMVFSMNVNYSQQERLRPSIIFFTDHIFIYASLRFPKKSRQNPSIKIRY